MKLVTLHSQLTDQHTEQRALLAQQQQQQQQQLCALDKQQGDREQHASLMAAGREQQFVAVGSAVPAGMPDQDQGLLQGYSNGASLHSAAGRNLMQGR